MWFRRPVQFSKDQQKGINSCVYLSAISSPTLILRKYFYGDRMKEYEMGGSCSRHLRDAKCKLEQKMPLQRRRCIRENSIKVVNEELKLSLVTV